MTSRAASVKDGRRSLDPPPDLPPGHALTDASTASSWQAPTIRKTQNQPTPNGCYDCRHAFAVSRLAAPEVCVFSCALFEKGRREGRAPAGTRWPLCDQMHTQMHNGKQVGRTNPAFPARMV